METQTRSIAKAVSYRILGSSVTALIVFVLTGRVGLSFGAGALDMISKVVAYYIHERIWNHIGYGRGKSPEYEI